MNYDVDWLEARARLTPDALAVTDGVSKESWTYKELHYKSSAMADHLEARGVQSGDRVAWLSQNDICGFLLMFACRKLNAIFVPLNFRLHVQEINRLAADCKPKILAYHEQFEKIAMQIDVEIREKVEMIETDHEKVKARPLTYDWEQPWMMIYTGGTTGKPKGVVLTNRSVYTNAVNTVMSWGLREDDTTITVLPMFHTGGINALTIPILFAGGTVVYTPAFVPNEIVQLIERHQCSIILMVPTMYHQFIQEPEFKRQRFSSMKSFLSGGAPCPDTIYEAFHERDLPFRQGYGLTEAGPNNFYISPERSKEKAGTVGKPMMYNAVKIMNAGGKEAQNDEVGELFLKGDHLYSYYWGENKSALSNRWFNTNDLAKRDDEGDYYILGRSKDMIITGGENVYPQEIEKLLQLLHEVDEVTVIGIADDKWGQRVVAVIVLERGCVLDQETVRTYCASHLARFKVPKNIIFHESLPKTDIGKINKNALQKEIEEGLQAGVYE